MRPGAGTPVRRSRPGRAAGIAAGALALALVAAPGAAQQPVAASSPAGAGGSVLLPGEAIRLESRGEGRGEVAYLRGHPDREGPYAFRLLVRDGFVNGPHTHPREEHVVVLTGRFMVGFGTTLDRSEATAYGPGSYIVFAPDVPAFMWAEGETLLHVYGEGPLETVRLEE